MAASIALTLALAAIGCVAVPGGPFASAFVPSCPNPSTSLRGPPTLALAAAAAAAAGEGEGEGGGSGHIPWNRPAPGGGDMAYVRSNLTRQAETYSALSGLDDPGSISDVYVRDPSSSSSSSRGGAFWYVGRVARCTGTVSLRGAVARQWNLIEEHATRLRPIELGRSWGRMEVWCAPGHTELRCAEDDPDVVLERCPRPREAGGDDAEAEAEAAKGVDARECGLLLEVVTNRGKGFCIERDGEGGVITPRDGPS